MKTPSVSVAVACAACMLSGCQSLSPKEAKQQAEVRWSGVRSKVKLQLAEQHFQRRQFADALSAASEAIALDAADAQAYALAAKCHLELGQAASAEHLLDSAAKAGATSPDLIYLRGVVLELREDLAGAVEAYHKARAADGTQVDFLLAEAECLAAAGQSQEGLGILAAHAHAYDERGDIALLAARIAELQHDPATAVTWYRQAMAFLPDNDVTAEGLGILLAQRSECAEAIHLLRPLVDNAPADADRAAARRALAACYMRIDDPLSAQAILTDHARRTLADAAAQLLLAQASLAANDVLTAAEAVHALEQAAPTARSTILTRAILDWKRGFLVEAVARLEGLIAAQPADAEAACLLGELLVSLDQPGPAAVEFERALVTDPGNAWARARLTALSR